MSIINSVLKWADLEDTAIDQYTDFKSTAIEGAKFPAHFQDRFQICPEGELIVYKKLLEGIGRSQQNPKFIYQLGKTVVPEENKQIYFGGRICKIISMTAAVAIQCFNRLLPNYLPEKINTCPLFDSRAFNVPNLDEAANAVLWKEQDATRNSISGAAHFLFGHKKLLGKNNKQKMEMLFQAGVNWNDYPTFFKKGSYFNKQGEMDLPPLRSVTHEERKKLLFG